VRSGAAIMTFRSKWCVGILSKIVRFVLLVMTLID
jgi:hypothetical protein